MNIEQKTRLKIAHELIHAVNQDQLRELSVLRAGGVDSEVVDILIRDTTNMETALGYLGEVTSG